MASTYSSRLRLELIATGEQSGTWGTTTNTNLGTLLEQAIAGMASVTHDNTANYTLTTSNGASDEARCMLLKIGGSLSANRNVVCPTVTKFYIINNNTSGGFSITIKTAAGTGITVTNGKTAAVWCDGTNVLDALTQLGSGIALASPAITGGTIAGATLTGTTTNSGTLSGGTISGITDLAIADGGTGASSASAARTNLGSTATGDALFTAASASAARTTLGLGTSATVNTGTSGATIPLLNGANTWSGAQTMSASAINYAEGSAVASAGTTNIWVTDGNIIHITGTTGITSFGTAPQNGATRKIVFDGALTLTNGANLILPSGANISTAAGDCCEVFADTTTQHRVINYERANGQALVASAGPGAATTTQVLTGTDTASYVTSDALAALWEQGSDVASSATISLGEGGAFNITGTTNISDIDFAVDKAGRLASLKFAGVLTLTNGANLILPGGGNITTAANDVAIIRSEGSDVIRVIAYQRASGNPVVLQSATTSAEGGARLADAAAMEAQTASRVVTADLVNRSPFVPKAWCSFDGTLAGTNAPTEGFNVTSVTRNATGDYTVNLAITMASTTYCVICTSTSTGATNGTKTTTTCDVSNVNSAGALANATNFNVVIFGDI